MQAITTLCYNAYWHGNCIDIYWRIPLKISVPLEIEKMNGEKMNKNRIKLYLVVMIIVPLFVVAALNTTGVRAVTNVDDETEAFYKAKCAACHGPTAAKFFNPETAVEEHVTTILDGKKGAKPPFMPSYKDKGVTPEKAMALAEYMLELHPVPAP